MFATRLLVLLVRKESSGWGSLSVEVFQSQIAKGKLNTGSTFIRWPLNRAGKLPSRSQSQNRTRMGGGEDARGRMSMTFPGAREDSRNLSTTLLCFLDGLALPVLSAGR